MNRRAFLKEMAVLGIGGGLVTSCSSVAPVVATSVGPRGAALRVAHLTDIHLRGTLDAPELTARAIRHAQDLPQPPDFILFGGDIIMDALTSTRENAITEWKRWRRLERENVRVPHHHCLGNHDIWGWGLPGSAARSGAEWEGKQMAMDMLGMARRYYSFDHGRWHFVVLDSIRFDARRRNGGYGYYGELDKEQFDWLAADLASAAADRWVCVLSHIPILSAAAYYVTRTSEPANWAVAGALMHTDSRRLKDLFKRHPRVKLCLSGHLHLIDDVTYLGVRHLCNGAVCGNWWHGTYQEFAPAYAVLDFFDDGTVQNTIVSYEG